MAYTMIQQIMKRLQCLKISRMIIHQISGISHNERVVVKMLPLRKMTSLRMKIQKLVRSLKMNQRREIDLIPMRN
jgi:hypothetical protein